MTRQTKALLVGSSFSAAPLLFALKRRGIHVTVCGNAADDPCHQHGDASIHLDYSQPEALREAVRAKTFDFLVPSCNDFAYLSSTQVAEEFGFPGFDGLALTRTLHTKALFRQFAEQAGLPVPKLVRRDDVEAGAERLRFPLLVKPVDSFSGRGMTKVASAAELPAAIRHARDSSRSGEFVVEEFAEGSLHSHSAFIRNRRIVHDVFVDEFCTVYPYQVNCSNHPSFLGDAARRATRSAMQALIDAGGLADGLLHTQFLADGDRILVVECMRRAPGDLYGHLIELSTGLPYTDFYLRPFIGETVPDEAPTRPARPVGRHTVSTGQPQTVFKFSHRIPARSVEIVPLKDSGNLLRSAPYDKLAILFAEFDSLQTLKTVTPALAEHVSIQTYS